MKSKPLIITLIVLSINMMISCKENPSSETKQMEQNEKVRSSDDSTDDDNGPILSSCSTQAFKEIIKLERGYDTNGQYSFNFNLPHDSVSIKGRKVLAELKYKKSYNISTFNAPMFMEIWQHGLDFKQPLCDAKTKPQLNYHKVGDRINNFNATEGKDVYIVIVHDEDWFKSIARQERILSEIEIAIDTLSIGFVPASLDEVLNALDNIIKPNTIGGGVIPPK